MKNENKPIDQEIEDIKGKLKLAGIMLLLAVPVLLLDLPMWLGFPIVGIGSVAVWYGLVKWKESHLHAGGKS
jgi:hypothetical protein